MPQVRASLPDLTPEHYRTPTPNAAQFTGTGYASGDVVARMLIDYGVDAWLQENGDAAIHGSLGVSYAALTVATYSAAAEAGVFAGISARVTSFGASSWRTIAGAAGTVGEGVRRYGNQVARWGAQTMRWAGGRPDAVASSAPRGGAVVNGIPGRMARVIPADFAGGSRLAAPGARNAWVTAAEDLEYSAVEVTVRK